MLFEYAIIHNALINGAVSSALNRAIKRSVAGVLIFPASPLHAGLPT